MTLLRGDGGSSEERPYDVSRGQNRYVTLPLARKYFDKLQQAGKIDNLQHVCGVFGCELEVIVNEIKNRMYVC